MARPVLIAVLAFAGAAACAVNMGGPSEVPLATIGLRAAPGTSVAAAADALSGADVALVASAEGEDWFAGLEEATGMHLSGPAPTVGDLNLSFLAMEPVGDTIIRLAHDGGTFVLLDALYALDEEGPFLDLMAFRVGDAGQARGMIQSLLQYVATDVMANAAVVFAVAVPDRAAGDSVARMFSPAYFDAARCEGDGADPAAVAGLRVFYGPEARMYCTGAQSGAVSAGERVRAQLVVGRRQ